MTAQNPARAPLVGIGYYDETTGQVQPISANAPVPTTGGAGGGAVTVADGADVAQGTTTDAATANTVIGRLKKLISLLPTALGSTTSANSLPVVIASDQGTVAVGVTARTTGGYTPGHIVSAASTNATSIKGSAGTLGYITASNVNAAARYLKVYNKASAPTVGTDTPVHTFIIPGNTAGAGTNIPIPTAGIKLDTGIAIALTTEATDAGSTGVAASEIVVNYGYI